MTSITDGWGADPPAAKNPRQTSGFVVAAQIVLYGLLALAFGLGSPVIRVGAGCALLLALLGNWHGGVQHLLCSLGLLLAIWLAPCLGAPLGEATAAEGNLPPAVAQALAMLFVAITVAGVFSMLGRRLTRSLRRRPRLNAANRVSGALLGSAEGALVAVCGCWLLATFEAPLETLRLKLAAGPNPTHNWIARQLAGCQTALRNDPAGRWLAQHNPLAQVPAVQTAQLVADLVADPGRLLAAIEAGRLDRLAGLPEVRRHVEAFRSDPLMQEALRQGDLSAILTSPQLRAMAADRELHRTLLAQRDEIRRALDGADYDDRNGEAQQLDAAARREVRNWPTELGG